MVVDLIPAQRALQMEVGRCERGEIRASNNVGDAQVHVIDHIRQVIAVDPVRIAQPEIPTSEDRSIDIVPKPPSCQSTAPASTAKRTERGSTSVAPLHVPG